MEEPILNRVEASGIIQLELERWLEAPPVVACDLASELIDGFVLMEKPFRAAVAEWKAADVEGKDVALHCSADAIVPDWAWMVAASRIVELGGRPVVGDVDTVRQQGFLRAVAAADISEFEDARVMLRGCASVGGTPVLAAVVERLQPVVRSLMYGEACSAVPVYKKPRR